MIGAGRAFADHQCMARAIGNVVKSHPRVEEKHAVCAVVVGAPHAEIVREGDRKGPEIPWISSIGVDRANECGNDTLQICKMRLGLEELVLSKRVERLLPHGVLFDVRQQTRQPAHVRLRRKSILITATGR